LALLEVKNIKMEFNAGKSEKMLLFDDLSFTMEDERFLTVLSPFGAGKSTLLKIITALVLPTSGMVLLNGNNYTYLAGKVVFIPENPSSYPWLNVEENIELISKNPDISQIIRLIGLEGYEDHYPDNNSYGFRFRIALGRAISINPALILLDDSMRKIDFTTKMELHGMIRNIIKETNISFLMATTDVSDALQLSDRVLIMKKKPAAIARKILIDRRDKTALLDLVSQLENIFQEDESNKSINFTI
jgi:NitT/TauT family transport system ATP-binding protein